MRANLGARAAALVAVGSLVTTGCGLGREQHLLDDVVAAADATARAGVVGATLRIELRPLAAPIGGAAVTSGVDALTAREAPTPAVLASTIDAARRRAVVAHAGGDLAVFHRDELFLRRPDAQPREARPWLELPLADLSSGATRFEPAAYKTGASYALAGVLDPRLLLDVAAAPLRGSLRELEGEDIGGRTLRHVEGNFDIDKALDDVRRDSYDDDSREAARLVLTLLSIRRAVNPGELWFDVDGLRRVRLEFQVRPSRHDITLATVTMDFDRDPTPIVAPRPRETVVVGSLSALQRAAAVLASPSPESGASG